MRKSIQMRCLYEWGDIRKWDEEEGDDDDDDDDDGDDDDEKRGGGMWETKAISCSYFKAVLPLGWI